MDINKLNTLRDELEHEARNARFVLVTGNKNDDNRAVERKRCLELEKWSKMLTDALRQ